MTNNTGGDKNMTRAVFCDKCNKIMHPINDVLMVCFDKPVGQEEMIKKTVKHMCMDCWDRK